jgi:tetratricopeptide (TPR) repeat protein
MLETIREYALELLKSSGEAEAIRDRHAEYFLGLARKAEEGLSGSEQATWLELLELEHDNFRAVLARRDGDLQLELAGALWRFWQVRGYFEEGQKQLGDVLEATPGDPALRAKALNGAANIAFSRADPHLMRSCAEEALELFKGLGDAAGVARALNSLANATLLEGDYTRAQQLYEQCRAWALEAGDPRLLALGIGNLGHLALIRGDYEEALALCRESLALERALQRPEGVATDLFNVGFAAFRLGRHDEAKMAIKESLELLYGLRNTHVLAECLSLAGALCASRGHPDQGARLLAMADVLEQGIGARDMHPAEQRLYDETKASIREELEPEPLAREQAAGRAASLDETVAYALQALQ